MGQRGTYGRAAAAKRRREAEGVDEEACQTPVCAREVWQASKRSEDDPAPTSQTKDGVERVEVNAEQRGVRRDGARIEELGRTRTATTL
jgi:hypothetical protein